MFLTSTSDLIRVVTGSAVATIGVHADWVDNSASTYTPGRTNTAITTATTTTVVGSPGASTVRNVKSLSLTNNHASSSCVVTIQHYDGTTSVDIEKITLKAGEEFTLAEDGEWRHLTAAGAEYDYIQPAGGNLGITGTIAETMPRELCNEANNGSLATGTAALTPIYLRAGQVVTNISVFSATTGAGTPTNWMFGLYSASLQLLCRSADQTTTAWAANTIATLAMTTPYTVQQSGYYYVAVLVVATTVPTLKGATRTATTINTYPLFGGFRSNPGSLTAFADSVTINITNGYFWAAIT